MEELKNRFLELKDADKYYRFDRSHPVAWYIGLDGRNRYSLFVITKTQPKNIGSTKLMNVFVGERKDSSYGITFSLLEKRNLDLFVHFCEDLILYTKHITKAEAIADSICGRYIQWQKAFIKTDGKLLSYEQIKGLIGELCFLKMMMIPLYGPEMAIDSWSGIEFTDQDFSCDGTWYEVKSTVSGATTVKISSVEQLDVVEIGHLVVVALDKTSEADTSRLTLNSIVELVIKSLPSRSSRKKYNGMTIYKVDTSFPCLRKKDTPAAVQNIKYEISLAAIDSFREE